MSRFLGLSKEECIALEKVEIERPLVCPDCIPDLSAPKIDWLSRDKPYFDPKTCEYIINYLAPNKTQGLTTSLSEYVKMIKPMGARELLKHFNKQNFKNMGVPNSVGNKKIKTSIKNTFIDRSNLIRIRIAINAIDFNKLPDRVVDPNEDTPPDNTASELPTEIIIDDTEGDFNINFLTSIIALRGYEMRNETFSLTKGGLVRRDNKDELVLFKIKNFIDNIKSFKNKLEDFLSDNGFDFLSPLSFFSFNRKVQKLRIELDNSNEESPLKIHKVFVEFEGCPETELLIGLDSFKQKAYMQEAIYFFANFSDFYYDVTGESTKDWLEFLDEYVYPPVYVDYGESPEDEKISDANPNCPAINIPFGDILENFLKDLTMGLGDLFSLEMDRNSCSQDPKKSNPTVKQFINPVSQREFEKAYRKDLKERKRLYEDSIKLYDDAIRQRKPNETEQDFLKRKQETIERKEKLLERIDRESQAAADSIVENDQKQNPDKYNPLLDQWKQAKEAKFNADNSIFEIWESVKESDDLIGEFTKFQTYINLIGLCGLNEGMQKALDCLFKQVSFEDAFRAIIKVTFETFPPDFFESVFLPGLTPLQQTEIRNKVAKKLGTNLENVTWPWEKRENNQQQKQKKAQEDAIRKQYTADLKEDVEKGEEEASKLYRDEQAKQTRILLKQNTDKTALDLTPEDYEIIEENTYKALEDKQVNKQLARADTDISGDLNEIAGDIFQAYVDVLFEYFSIDDLLETFKSVPMVGLIIKFGLSFIKCPTKILKDLEQNKIKEFKLDICNPTAPVINVKIPQIDFSMSPLKIVTENISKIIRETIVRVLSRLISTILKLLEDALCKLAELAGKLALRPDQFFGDLPGTFREAFCPNANDDEAREIGNNLLNKIGLKDDDISSAIDCLGGALAGSFTQDELVSLMVDENPSPSLLDRVADAVRIGCPRFGDVFGDRDGARNLFNKLRDLIPQAARDRLRELTQIPSNMPLYETICLSSEELENWDNIRRGNLGAAGLSPEEAAQQVENYNQRARDTLEDIMRDMSHPEGPDAGISQVLEDALNDLFASNPNKPPGCDLAPGESNYGSKAVKEPETLIQMQDDLSDRIMDIVGDSFDREYASNPNPFNPSLIHRIMRDTEGNDYGAHRFRENFFITRMGYHDSPGSEEAKETAPWWTKFLGGILDDNDPANNEKDKGYFPETIGKDLEVQATVLSDYNTKEQNILTPDGFTQTEYKVLFDANYLYEDGSYGYVGYNSENISNTGSMDYTVLSSKFNSPRKQFIETVETEDDVEILLSTFNLTEQKRKREAFRKLIEQKLSILETKPTIDYNTLFDKTCEKVFNSTQVLMFKDSEGLIFGYEEEDITEDQLKYVGPNGEEPYDNYFKEEDRKLGRAKEETNRVFFLDPEKYGGSYQTPPVYIKPKKNVGWMKISSVLSPEKAPCPPEADSIVVFSDLKKHVNNVRNSLNHDPRISNSVEKCFSEKPFDKILSKNAASCIDGIVRMHIRMAFSRNLTRSIPVISNVKYNDNNYGNAFVDLVFDNLQNELSEVNPFWPAHIKTHIYEMLVFEQIVQSYEREIITPLPSGSIDGKDLSSLPETDQVAWQKITEIRENYSYENEIVFSKKIDNIPSISTLDEPYQSELFAVYGMAYKKWGEQIFDNDFTFNWSGVATLPGYPPTPILPFVDYKTFAKALAIRLVRDEVKVIVKRIIQIESEKMLDHLYRNFEPKIENLTAFLLTSKDLFHNNSIKNFGTTDYYNKIKMTALPTVGDAENVVLTTKNETPWKDSPQNEVLFKIEKYVRFIKKEEGGNEVLNTPRRFEENLREYFGNKGVMSLEAAQEFIDLQKEEYGDLYISELFGNAELTEDFESYSGQMGISYGLRIIMKIPENLYTNESETINQNDASISNLEKTFYCKTSERYRDLNNSNNFSIPIITREIELKDKQLKDINFITGDDKYDLICLLEKMEKSTEYKLLFKYLCPIKAASTMMLVYSDSFFIESIGMNDGWAGAPEGEEGDNLAKKKPFLGEWDHKTGVEFADTSKVCRKYFSSFYYSTKFIHDENFNLPKIELPDFMKILFGSFELPQINLSIPLPDLIDFPHKIIRKNPLNKNDEVCEEPVDKFLS